ncbi:DUF998 domain-containing protein [Streptomyces triculaminicus]|uniref:DUF998 domain-containing protein n=3 Tax=Streptomyces TaxID=1883 RepID=A0A939JQP6_9ACTN|nr:MULTISPECIES: DUF998 domain-containing protein [Streptomyces]MBO0653952.1 DUF998 domain-containing protein [Streptomyces triculaminicus]QSY48703.1 DUF998 domain-containing protein [Streptomyces griseocarneus]
MRDSSTVVRGAAAGRLHGRPAAAVRGGRASLLLATAAVVYNDWLLEFLLPTGLDARHSYVSELYAADQRFHVLFGGIEIIAAVLVVTGALLARDRTAGGLPSAGWWSLVAFGAFSVADVIVPMHCAPSIERGCEAVNPWHTTTSALVHAALFASMALLVLASGPGPCPRPLIRRRGPWVLAGALLSALATVGPLFGRPGWHGVPQRAHLVLVGVWFLLLAGALRKTPETADAPVGARRVPAPVR